MALLGVLAALGPLPESELGGVDAFLGIMIGAALGIGGSLAATFLGQAAGWYAPGQSAGFIGAVIGAVLLLITCHFITKS